ncbi:2-oxoacid:acceptor oxidoreductase family protein [Kribbella solani]|uniref:Pyruvate ferredoxin oxidoreductase gamma subunit n=1 Tax=Kribbella solani TaxID=236067 RepID=A0A841DLF0_9ACTN|nr:2-oxoacid:acceptor oxidoreductase family protein [Kribbella solani]MBB5978509.1 pyruvate ferredoxin oxidoreductase gamma subunit [Kribbella solani]
MFEIRFHGRGGQGVVTTTELLSVAAFAEGRHAQAFPTFGSERTGAPVVGFCRIGDHPIRSHDPIAAPNALIVQDATLLRLPGVLTGLAADGYLLVNSARTPAELGLDPSARVLTVPATELALTHLGRPLPGAVLLGAFAAFTGQVRLDSVLAAIRERFSGAVAVGNITAARSAYGLALEETARARTD